MLIRRANIRTFSGEWSGPGLPVILLALFNILIHLLVANNLGYNRDELLYFSFAQHPDFGFATVPPVIGWVAWIVQHTLGNSLFAVRLFPALLSGIMVLLISALTSELGGSYYARILASTGFIISGFGLRTFALYMPVHIDVFFWTLIIYLVIRYVNKSSDKTLVWLGITAGLSLMNKYLIGILFLSILAVIPFTPYRDIFKKGKFWIGIFFGILIFLPNIIWQVVHGLPVIGHMSELERTQLVHVDRISFLTDQLIMPSWASVLTIAGIIFLLREKEAEKFRFMGISVLISIFLIMMLRGKGYYTIGVFPFLISAGAVSYERWIKKTWLRIVVPLSLVLLTIPTLPLGLPVFSEQGMVTYFKTVEDKFGIQLGRRFEDRSIHSLPQDYADMLGWEELALLAEKAYQMVPDKKASLIYCENYGQAGAITIIGKKYGLPEAVSFNESFRYWIPTGFNPDISSFIYINHELGKDVARMFGKITLVGQISDPNARELGAKVYLCQEPVSSFNEFWKRRLQQLNESR
jgi:hypothetical protein